MSFFKKSRRIICMVLAVLTLLSCTNLAGWQIFASADSGFDSGFEQAGAGAPFAGWELGAANAIEISRDTAEVHSGEASLKLVKPEGSEYRNVDSMNSVAIPVEAGAEYALTVWEKIENANGAIGLVSVYAKGYTSLVTEGATDTFTTLQTENGWAQKQTIVTIPDGITEVILRIMVLGTQTGGSAVFHYDDIAFRKQAAVQAPVFDPGFEQSGADVGTTAPFGSWELGAANTIEITRDTTDFHSGVASLKIVKPEGSDYRNIDSLGAVAVAVEPGTKYALTLWEKIENANGAIGLVSVYAKGYTSLVTEGATDTFTTLQTENGWAQKQTIVTIPNGITEVIFRIMVLGTQTGGSAVFHYDDIAFQKQAAVQEPVFDPGFEQSGADVGTTAPFGSWELGAANTIEITRDTTDFHSGTASLKIVKPEGSDYRNIDSLGAVAVAVEPGTKYALTLWEKIENANGAIGLVSVYAKGYTSLVTEGATDTFTTLQTENGWAQKQTIVTIPDGITEVIFRIMVLGTQTGGTAVFHYDDLELQKQENLVTPVFDPGFEISGEAAGFKEVPLAAWELGTDTAPTDVTVHQDTGVFHSGKAAVCFTKPAGSDSNAFVQNTHYKVPIIGGDTYALRLWVKTENVQGASYGLLLIRQDWGWVKSIGTNELSVVKTQGAWTQVEAVIKLPQEMTEAIIRIVVQGRQTQGNGSFWFDDLELTPVDPIDTSFDPGFENVNDKGKLNAWVDGGGSLEYVLDTEEKHSGSYALKIFRPKDVEGTKVFEVAEPIPVKSNTTYYIRYFGKALNLSLTDNMYLNVVGDGMAETPVAATGNRSSDGWFKEYGCITTGETTTAIKLQVCTSGKNTSGQDGIIWFDDILIEEAPVGTGTFDGSFDVIVDGEALNWKYAINGAADDFAYAVAGNGYEGTGLTLNKKGTGYIAAMPVSIAVEGGESYELTYYVKTENAADCAAYVMVEQFKDSACANHTALNGYSIAYTVYGNTAGWKKVVCYFTAEEDAVAVKLIPTFNDSSTGQSYSSAKTASATFDEISVVQVPTLGPMDNFNFEYGYEVPRDWTFAVDGTNKTLYSVSMTDSGLSGRAVQLHANSTTGYATLISRNVPVKPSTQYLVTYYVRVSGPDSAKTLLGFHMANESGNASPEWLWTDPAYNVMGPCGWMKVSIPITTAANCTLMDFRFLTSGVGTVATIDRLSIEELTPARLKKLNLSFESGDYNWLFVRSGDPQSALEVDTDNYHQGQQSVHFVKNSVAAETKLVSLGRLEVVGGQKLLFGGYFKSKNATTSKLQINLNVYDNNDALLATMPGRAVVLNNSATVNDWTKLAVTAQVPAGAAYACFEISVTAGQAELWLDDLFYRIVNESAGETLVDFSDFSSCTEKGSIQGWSLQGSGTLTQEEGRGRLTVKSGAQAYMVYEAQYFVPTKCYRIEADYSSAAEGELVIAFYDYMGNHIQGIDVTQKLPKAEQGKLDISFTAPSATTAKLCIGSDQAGTYYLDDLNIYLSETADPAQSWLGKWVWYQEDALTEAVKEHRYFIYRFNLEGKPTYAPIQISGDDNFTLYINGAEVGGNMGEGQDQWSNPITYDILRYLQKGENVIAVDAYNVVSYAALIFDARITMDDGSVVMLGSDGSVVASKTAPAGWTELGYDCSGWEPVKEIGYPPCSPWGGIYFDTSLYADNAVVIEDFAVPEEIEAGTTIDITATFRIEEKIDTDYPIEISIWKKNTTKEITAGILEVVDGNTTSQWEVGSNTVNLRLYIPDYLESGRYTLQLSDNYLYLANEEVVDNKFANIKVVNEETDSDLPQSEVKEFNGKPTLFIDGEAKAPLFYLEPAGEVWWDLSSEQKVQESTTELYVTNSIFLSDPNNRNDPIWVDADTIDYDTFDKYVYQTLSGNPDAKVMIAIGMNAPRWWLDLHPEDELLLEAYDTNTGKSTIEQPATRAVSFASETYRQEAGQVLRLLVEHISQASYASHIYGIKIQDGETCEYMIQGADDYNVADFSSVALKGFQAWVKETYKTEEALREAWNDSKVTFDSVTVPKRKDRGAANDRTLLNVEKNRKIIDYQYYVNSCSADYFLHYADIIKEASGGKLLAGAYYGYLWNFNSPGANSAAHPAVDKILASDSVDFVCSPFIYGERDWTESTAYDDMMDGIRASGKLYILELDTRSVYDSPFGNAEWDSEVGYSYTMDESIDSVKRDFASLIADGAGFWFFNMYGTWWYDSQFMQLFADMKDELYVSTYTETSSTSDIAVFVDEMMYPYISGTDVYGAYEMLSFLLTNQRRSLAHIGAPYDTYQMSDLVNGTVPDYKINIMLSPFEVTEEEKTAIEQQLKKDGKTIVWIYLPGISNGTTEGAENISQLTGFQTRLITQKTVFNAVFKDTGTLLTEGIAGWRYGNENTAHASPLAYIADQEATTLATLMYGSGSYTALAVKDMGDWTSIYSTVPNLPGAFFKNLLKQNGCHIYSEDSDIIYANDHYVSCYSPYSGKVTLKLPGNYSVYDVFAQEYYSMDTDTITYTADQGQTKTFRLMTPGKVAVLSRVCDTGGEMSTVGLTELKPGEGFQTNITSQPGYYISRLTLNGEELEPTDSVVLENVEDYQSLVCYFEKGTAPQTAPEEVLDTDTEVAEPAGSRQVRWLIPVAAVLLAAAGTMLAVMKKKKRTS